ncbi:MAG: exopolysaccharide biosynthesis protein [Candidatus Nomurabacteria bacterium]|nr:MAG: exopolysaccharide biosynthesis protein [Candidatus Nomurabacteria bacterium]HRV76052.1 exopolysaccharide biosynthesis protein [Candidatus Saccharimonadales bacterium]
MSKKQTKLEKDFSFELSNWLKSDNTKSLLELDTFFGDKTFAILFMFMMAASALPIPTGGVTDVFAIITVLFSAQLILGRKNLWLPKRWRKMKLNKLFLNKLLPGLVKLIRWLEKYSNPRLSWVFKGRLSDILLGLSVAVLAIATIAAPPFSGLDTIPALGVVIISAGIVLKDGLMTLIGWTIGASGILIQLLLGKAAVELFQRVF